MTHTINLVFMYETGGNTKLNIIIKYLQCTNFIVENYVCVM